MLCSYISRLTSESWFWKRPWRIGEREVDAHVKSGEIRVTDGVQEFLISLPVTISDIDLEKEVVLDSRGVRVDDAYVARAMQEVEAELGGRASGQGPTPPAPSP
jgi:hypothetical protein